MNLAPGIYVFLSPWILRDDTLDSATALVNWLGAIVVMISAIALAVPRAWEEWGNFIVGILLGISPWGVGFPTSRVPTINDVILGIVILLVALSGMNFPLTAGHRQHGI
jgi:hypothetical protein